MGEAPCFYLATPLFSELVWMIMENHGGPLSNPWPCQGVRLLYSQSGQGLVLAFSPFHDPFSHAVPEDGFMTFLSLAYPNCKLMWHSFPYLVLSEPTWRLRIQRPPPLWNSLRWRYVGSWIPSPGSGKISDPISRLNSLAILAALCQQAGIPSQFRLVIVFLHIWAEKVTFIENIVWETESPYAAPDCP